MANARSVEHDASNLGKHLKFGSKARADTRRRPFDLEFSKFSSDVNRSASEIEPRTAHSRNELDESRDRGAHRYHFKIILKVH